MAETSVPPSGDDLPANASAHVNIWPYQHSIEDLDRCWDAYMEATVTPGALNGAFVELALQGMKPYHLSHIFDLMLTVADRTVDHVVLEGRLNEPYPDEIEVEIGQEYTVLAKATWNGQTWSLADGSYLGTKHVVDVLDLAPGTVD